MYITGAVLIFWSRKISVPRCAHAQALPQRARTYASPHINTRFRVHKGAAPMMAVSSGLVVPKRKDVSLPLKSVSVEAQVRGFVMGLRSTLTYSNDSPDPVEVLFRFPVEKSHAVVALTAVIDGRKIAAQLREKEEARAQYDDARSRAVFPRHLTS